MDYPKRTRGTIEKPSKEQLLYAKPSSIVFGVALGFLNLEDSHSRISGEINKLVLAHSKESGLRIRMDRESSEVSATNVRVRFRGDLDFQCELRSNIFGIQFGDAAVIPAAFDLTCGFVNTMAALHEDSFFLPNIDTISLSAQHVFKICGSNRKNWDIMRDKLIPSLTDNSGVFGPFTEKCESAGRTDLKTTFKLPGARNLFLSIECPGNDDYSTVWVQFDCRTDEGFQNEIEDSRDAAQYMADFVRDARSEFEGPYARFLQHLLGGETIDFDRE